MFLGMFCRKEQYILCLAMLLQKEISNSKEEQIHQDSDVDVLGTICTETFSLCSSASYRLRHLPVF